MTQPQYAPQPQGYAPPAPQQPYQPDPAQGYAPQPQGFAPPQQQYPPQQPYGPQGFAPQPGYGAPQQPYGGQQQAPAPQLATGSLDDFFNQPSTGGGAALKFGAMGTWHIGRVTREIGKGDIQQQTVVGSNAPAFYNDGRPKFVMKVPMAVVPSAEHPDGLAQWYCSGQSRDALVQAMAEQGAPAGPPEAGSVIAVGWTNERSAGAGRNKAKVYEVRYLRPGPEADQYAAQVGIAVTSTGQAPTPPPAAPPAQPPAPAPAPQQQAPTPAAPPQPPAYAPPQAPAQPPAAPPVPQQQAPAPAAPPAQPPAPPAAGPADLSPDQQALFARLTGAQQG